ncbi:TATA box-binding protein-associated factor RNA polymerase I subunit B isoform X2 [Mobula birostris]|uniref:TATA box-binding protein-associated factor RNA polymerase I subunit B isoform X2 n=1 Tax=Mobula birostris TaxID=1983395 RepID=UPI003B283A30
MDEENTRDFRQPCQQCSVINWGISDEGKFFCKSCHSVIEKTADIASELFMQNARVNTISRGLRKRKKLDQGCEWYVCEGFQYILTQQAKALIALGASPLIKDEILCNVWRRYLQKSQQAYTNKPIAAFTRKQRCIPSYDEIQRKMHQLAEFLDMPRFPEITEKCFLHPNLLCMKYLLEANLPESMCIWTQRLVKKMGIGNVDYLTFHPLSRGAKTINYEIQAVAVIVISLKLLFVLDDKHEWLLSNRANEINKQNDKGIKHFQFRKWYKVMKSYLDESEKEVEEQAARYLWKCEKPLFFSAKDQAVVYKRKRIIHSLTKQFVRLTSQPALERKEPSSFRFSWNEDNLERPCFHGDSLKGYDNEKSKRIINVNDRYWLCCLKICNEKSCRHLTKSELKHFPGSYLFVLKLFAFLLGVGFSVLHNEVCQLEHKLFDVSETLKPGKTCKKSKLVQ